MTLPPDRGREIRCPLQNVRAPEIRSLLEIVRKLETPPQLKSRSALHTDPETGIGPDILPQRVLEGKLESGFHTPGEAKPPLPEPPREGSRRIDPAELLVDSAL